MFPIWAMTQAFWGDGKHFLRTMASIAPTKHNLFFSITSENQEIRG